MFTVSTWTCQARFGSFSIAIMQLTETTVTPSIIAWPVAGSSGYVASPSMSDRARPESSTAPLTASSACAAGVIHDRVRIDGALAADRLERQVDRHAAHAGGVRRMLEVLARLTALQRQHAALGRFPEGLRPLVRDGNRPGHLAPVAHRQGLAASKDVGAGRPCQAPARAIHISTDVHTAKLSRAGAG